MGFNNNPPKEPGGLCLLSGLQRSCSSNFFPQKIAWSIQLSQIITGIFFYTNNKLWLACWSHFTAFNFLQSHINADTCKAIMFHLNPIRGQPFDFWVGLWVIWFGFSKPLVIELYFLTYKNRENIKQKQRPVIICKKREV